MDIPVAARMDIPVAARMQSGSSLSIFIDGSVVETDMANPRYKMIKQGHLGPHNYLSNGNNIKF